VKWDKKARTQHCEIMLSVIHNS